MITYLLKTIVCSGIFWALYSVLFEKEKMHRFNRFYLLGSLVLSLLIPLISFTVHTHPITELPQVAMPDFVPSNTVETFSQQIVVQQKTNYLPLILGGIYVLVSLLFAIKFISGWVQLYRQIHRHKTVRFKGSTLVIIPDNKISYAFFGYIFPSKDDFNGQEMEEKIWLHERTHATQKHSLDILLVEVLKIVFWFNPFVFLFKKSIQLNHEFLADGQVLQNGCEVYNYQHLLLSKFMLPKIMQLVSGSNYSLTKKRFIMMTKKTNSLKACCLKLIAIPILAASIFLLGNKVIANTINEGENRLQNSPENILFAGGSDSDIVSRYNAGYNKIKIEGTNKKGQYYVGVSGYPSDFRKLSSMYNSMTEEQKSKVVEVKNPKFMDIKKLPIPKRIQPTQAQLEKWQSPKLYGVWVDGKRIKNKSLSNYKASDFVYYDASNLTKAARLNDGFNVQIEIRTEQGYLNLVKELKAYNPEDHKTTSIKYVDSAK